MAWNSRSPWDTTDQVTHKGLTGLSDYQLNSFLDLLHAAGEAGVTIHNFNSGAEKGIGERIGFNITDVMAEIKSTYDTKAHEWSFSMDVMDAAFDLSAYVAGTAHDDPDFDCERQALLCKVYDD